MRTPPRIHDSNRLILEQRAQRFALGTGIEVAEHNHRITMAAHGDTLRQQACRFEARLRAAMVEVHVVDVDGPTRTDVDQARERRDAR